MSSQKTMLNSRETAKAIGVDRKTLRKWVKEGRCPIAPIDGLYPHRWFVADVAEWVRRAVAS